MHNANVDFHYIHVFRVATAVRLVDDHGNALFRLVRGRLCVSGFTLARVSVRAHARGFFYRRKGVGAIKVRADRVAALSVVNGALYRFLGDEAVNCVDVVGAIGDE